MLQCGVKLGQTVYLAAWNDSPKPFVWTATVDSIVEKLCRCRQTLEQIQPGCTATSDLVTSQTLTKQAKS